MSTSFLNYYKTVLEKVSFDQRLFQKEYEKALSTLGESEAGQLNQWLQAKKIVTKSLHQRAAMNS